MVIEDELPNEIEFFLILLGFYKRERVSNSHAPVTIPSKEKSKYVAWKPSYPGEDPPF